MAPQPAHIKLIWDNGRLLTAGTSATVCMQSQVLHFLQYQDVANEQNIYIYIYIYIYITMHIHVCMIVHMIAWMDEDVCVCVCARVWAVCLVCTYICI